MTGPKSELDPRPVLGLFAKQPRAGHVKSRLAADTSPEWAAQVATAFLKDLLRRLAVLAVRRVLVYDPPEARNWFEALVQDRFGLAPQAPGDLGERLSSFLGQQFQNGAERVVLVGMDSPTLPVSFVEQAFAKLREFEVVLGPATDGGYYLLGMNRFEPRLLQDIHWSSPRVLFDTCERIGQCGHSLFVLPPWYDVDTLDDWWLLRGHLAALRLAGIDVDVSETESLMNET